MEDSHLLFWSRYFLLEPKSCPLVLIIGALTSQAETLGKIYVLILTVGCEPASRG